jgi:hypothetical protein
VIVVAVYRFGGDVVIAEELGAHLWIDISKKKENIESGSSNKRGEVRAKCNEEK